MRGRNGSDRLARINRPSLLAPLVFLLSLSGCASKDRPLFRLLTPAQTGVTFANTITTSDSLNVQTH